MSYGYTPRFSSHGLAGLHALEPWLQEEVLDEIDRLIESVPMPDVAQRLESLQSIHDMSRVSGGVQHLLFVTTLLDVGARQMQITQIGHHARPSVG